MRQDGGDAVTAAKALRDFARSNPNLVVKGGILGSRVLTDQGLETLADVPPREELLARLAGGFQAPLVKAAGLFQAFTRNFAYGLKAYADQRGRGRSPRRGRAEAGTRARAAAESEPEPQSEPEAPGRGVEPNPKYRSK